MKDKKVILKNNFLYFYLLYFRWKNNLKFNNFRLITTVLLSKYYHLH